MRPLLAVPVGALTIGLVLLEGCRSPAEPTPRMATANGERKCDALRSVTEPDLVAWDSSSRALLNTQRRYGAVVVRFEAKGCDVELEVLTRCIAPERKYEYTPYFSAEHKTAHDEGELYTKLPLGAASLSGAMRQGESIRADLMNVGVVSLPPEASYKRSDLKGAECARATHVIGRMYLGAFALATGQTREIEAAASVFGAGAGGGTSSLRSLGREEGDLEECERAKVANTERPNCAVPLRLGLVPLLDVSAAVGVGAQASSFVFDGVKIGDPMARLELRPGFETPCSVRTRDDDKRQARLWLPRGCRRQGATVAPEETAVVAFARVANGRSEEAKAPIEAIAVLGGSYFTARSTFPLRIGDVADKATGAFGAPKATFELGTKRGPKLFVQQHRDDVWILVVEGKIAGFVAGSMPTQAGPSTSWGAVAEAYDESAREMPDGARAKAIDRTPVDAAAAAMVEPIGRARAALCARAATPCKARDASIRPDECERELTNRYQIEYKTKCLSRMQSWVECMTKNLDTKLEACVPLRIVGCAEEEAMVAKCR